MIAAAAGSIWVANSGDPSISRIDPATNRVVAHIDLPSGKIVDLAANEEFVFAIRVDKKELDRVDVATNELTTFAIESDYGGLALAGGWVWHAASTGELLRIDPESGEVDARVSVSEPGPPADVTADESGAWTVAGGELVRVTGDQPAVVRRWEAPAEAGLSIDAGRVWAIGFDGTAMSVDLASGTPSEPISIGQTPYMSEAAHGSLWMRGSDLDLRQIDPVTGETLVIYPIDGTDLPGGFVIVGGEAWVANLDRGSVSRISLTD